MKASALGIGALALAVVSMTSVGCGSAADTAFGPPVHDAGHRHDVTVDTGPIQMLMGAPDGGSVTCNALSCAQLGYNCGATGDGCGNMLDCGTCAANESCGGGGKFSVCGGAGPCKPKTCQDLGANCGPQGDGCGGVIQCGSCSHPDICGGGGKPSNCGTNGAPHPDGGLDGGPCVPETCASLNVQCGPAGDGCGNMLDCGGCNAGQSCGGGGMNGQCGAAPVCTPADCSNAGPGATAVGCGAVGDGCGNVIQCGSCNAPDICGGGGVPYQCGNAPTCTGLCAVETTTAMNCGGTNTTTLSGTVVAGTLPQYIPSGFGPDPIPNVLVYVPNATPAAFTTGVQCQPCGADVSGDPLIEATTDANGNFTLTNVPVPSSGTIPLVIQLGRWRRIFGLGNGNNPGIGVTACQANNAGSIRMPRNSGEGDIPLTAISTGEIDPMECVLLKMGVDHTEFRNPGAGGRIEMYQGNGAIVNGGTPGEMSLVPSMTGGTGTLDQYDQVLFPCWADDPLQQYSQNVKTQKQLDNVVNYANGGGRIFATHLSYSWLENIGGASTPWNATATWAGDPIPGTDIEYNTGSAVIEPPPGLPPGDVTTFYNWMNGLAWNGAMSGVFPIVQERNNFTATSVGTTLWMSTENAAPTISCSGGADCASYGTYPTSFPLVYVFPTPFQATTSPTVTQCGKVIYSDFHVSVIAGNPADQSDNGYTFPDECTGAPMTAQEKALEYLIWDLASCVPGPPGPTCTPQTCEQQGISCGPAGDGCGNEIQCGSCTGKCESCGGGGTPGVCGGVCCVPQTCESQNIQCGPAGDGCGNAIQCGGCSGGLACGGGGINGKCGSLAGPTCQPQTCEQQGIKCGPAGDGCGNEIQCGSCQTGELCGAGGMPGICAPVCVPTTCAKLGLDCGPTGDGCGGELQCGTCTPPASCGGGGKASVCGGTSAK
jgi:hypothetical protein